MIWLCIAVSNNVSQLAVSMKQNKAAGFRYILESLCLLDFQLCRRGINPSLLLPNTSNSLRAAHLGLFIQRLHPLEGAIPVSGQICPLSFNIFSNRILINYFAVLILEN